MDAEMEIKRGEIYWIGGRGNHIEGSEQKADRPAIIVSNNTGNKYSPVVEVVYCTNQEKKTLPTHTVLQKVSTGDAEGSTVLCEQVCTVSKNRIYDANSYIGRVSDEDMQRIDKAIAVSLGLDYLYDNCNSKSVQETICEAISTVAEQEAEQLNAISGKTVKEHINLYRNGYTMELTPEENSTDENMAREVIEVDFYKEKYDNLLERVFKKAGI